MMVKKLVIVELILGSKGEFFERRVTRRFLRLELVIFESIPALELKFPVRQPLRLILRFQNVL